MPPIITTQSGGIRPVERPQSPGVDGIQRREGGESPFQPRTDVALRSAVQDIGQLLTQINSAQKEVVEKIPPELKQVIDNIMQQAFSIDQTLGKGVGSTLESQRFSMDQLAIFSRMILQTGALADKGFSMELPDSLRTLFTNLKSYLAEQVGNSLEPVLLAKASFDLLNTETTDQMPPALANLISQMQAGASSTVQPSQDQSGMGFLKQLVQYFMPQPESEKSAQQNSQNQTQTESKPTQQQTFANQAYRNMQLPLEPKKGQPPTQFQPREAPRPAVSQTSNQSPQVFQQTPEGEVQNPNQARQNQNPAQNLNQSQNSTQSQNPNQTQSSQQSQQSQQTQTSQPQQTQNQTSQTQNTNQSQNTSQNPQTESKSQPPNQNQTQQSQQNQQTQSNPQNPIPKGRVSSFPQIFKQPPILQPKNSPPPTQSQQPNSNQTQQTQSNSQPQNPNQAQQTQSNPQSQNPNQTQQTQSNSQPQNPNQAQQTQPNPQPQNLNQTQQSQSNPQPQNPNQTQQTQQSPQTQRNYQTQTPNLLPNQGTQSQPSQNLFPQSNFIPRNDWQTEPQQFIEQSLRETMKEAKQQLLKQPMQNSEITMGTMRDAAQMLLKNANLSQQDSQILQQFVNQNDSALSKGDARHLQNLLRLCQQNVPITVQQAAIQQNLPELPRIWSFMQLCDMAQIKKMPSKDLKRIGRDVADFVISMKHSMAGSNSQEPGIQNQRSVDFMTPLYLGENGESYPAYIHVYDEKNRDVETGQMKKETWFRVCVLTDALGPVELVSRVYDGSQLDMRLYFVDQDSANQFREEYLGALQNSMKDNVNLSLNDFRVMTI